MTREQAYGMMAAMGRAHQLEGEAMAREVWAETILIRAFRNILDGREYLDTLGSRRGAVLAERLARAAVAALKERHLLASDGEDDETKQSDTTSDGGSAATDAGAR